MKRSLLFTCALGASLITLAQPGSLDSTFADNAVIKNINFLEIANEFASHTIVDSQDRIWIAGHTVINGDYQLILARLSPDGNYDATFSDDGHAVVNVALNNIEQVKGLAFQGNNLLIAGDKTSNGIKNQFVIRITPEGFLDPTFGAAGIADLPFNASVTDIAVDATGHIFLSGVIDGAVCASKLLPNGNPDPSFSSDGFRSVSFNSTDVSSAIAVDANGVVWIFGYSLNTNGLSRGTITSFLPNGNNNAAFAFTTRKTYPWPNNKDFFVFDGLLSADGTRFYLSGFTAQNGLNAAMMAVDLSGEVIEGFGNNGYLEFDATFGGDEAIVDILEGDEGIYAALLLEEVPTGSNSGLAYFSHSGNFITDFGNGGWMMYNIVEAGTDQPVDLDFQSDGSIILVGIADGEASSTYSFAARIMTSAETNSLRRFDLEKAMVYPNPCNDIITIVLNDITPGGEIYRIFNATGQMVDSGILNGPRQAIPTGFLTAGTYQVLIGERAHTRFVKTY